MQVTVAKYISLLANDVNQPHKYTKYDDIRIKMQAIISLLKQILCEWISEKYLNLD